MLKKSWCIIFFSFLFIYSEIYAKEEQTKLRIISLSPHLTENAFSAGAGSQLVGVVEYSNYPNQTKNIPLVGSYNAINFEHIIRLKPDLILVWQDGNRWQDIKRLQSLGFNLFFSKTTTLQNIPQEIIRIGELNGTKKIAKHNANKLISILNITKNNSSKLTANNKLKVFYEIWHKPLMTINKNSFISQAINLCGGKNVFADLAVKTAGEVSLESLLILNPQLILLGGDNSVQQKWKQDWLRYPSLNAVKNKHLVTLQADLYQRPTARLILALPDLCKIIKNSHTYYFDNK